MALSFSFFFIWDSNLLIRDSNRSTSICLLEFGFKSLHEGFKSLNRDSNRWLSASLLSSHRIQIAWLRIRIGQPQFAYWNLDSNLFMKDSNRPCQSELSGIWIRIAMGGIRIAFVSLHFLECGLESLCEGFESLSSNLLEKLQNWRICWEIRISLLGIRIWPLENSLKCSFVKIFLGIFIYILKTYLAYLVNITWVFWYHQNQQGFNNLPLFDDDKTP